MSAAIRFRATDFADGLPAPGCYHCTITSARFRRSSQGNRMLQIVFTLEDVVTERDWVADYFVLEGASPRGVATARRRLLRLCRACGLEPQDGDEIGPDELLHARLEVKVDHDEYNGQRRLRVVAYHRPTDATDDVQLLEDAPF